jgi:hypothetical protein
MSQCTTDRRRWGHNSFFETVYRLPARVEAGAAWSSEFADVSIETKDKDEIVLATPPTFIQPCRFRNPQSDRGYTGVPAGRQ